MRSMQEQPLITSHVSSNDRVGTYREKRSNLNLHTDYNDPPDVVTQVMVLCVIRKQQCELQVTAA